MLLLSNWTQNWALHQPMLLSPPKAKHIYLKTRPSIKSFFLMPPRFFSISSPHVNIEVNSIDSVATLSSTPLSGPWMKCCRCFVTSLWTYQRDSEACPVRNLLLIPSPPAASIAAQLSAKGSQVPAVHAQSLDYLLNLGGSHGSFLLSRWKWKLRITLTAMQSSLGSPRRSHICPKGIWSDLS